MPLPSDLKAINLFSEWTNDELNKIMFYFEEEHLNKGDILFKQNDLGSKIYFIKSGCIELDINITDSKDSRLTRLKSGEMFGEMSVIDNKKRSATAIAFSNTTLLSFKKDALTRLLAESEKGIANKFLISIIKDLSSRIRSINDSIRHLKLFT